MGQVTTSALSNSDKNQASKNSCTCLACLSCISRKIQKVYAACELGIFADIDQNVHGERTRGNSSKLMEGRVRQDIRKNSLL